MAAFGWTLFILGGALAGFRAHDQHYTGGPATADAAGFYDFEHGVYYPAQAYLSGISPYGKAFTEAYHCDLPAPLFTPSTFVLHWPFQLIPLPVAGWTYFALSLLLAAAVARLCASGVGRPELTGLIAGVLTLSRGGHSTLYTGYITLEVVLGVLLALEYAGRRPWISAFGIVLASQKANFALPLVLLMIARGDLRASLRGVVVATMLAALPTCWIAYHVGWYGMLESLLFSIDSYAGVELLHPTFSNSRIDAYALACKWSGDRGNLPVSLGLMVLLLLPVAAALRRQAASGFSLGATTPSGALIALAILVSVDHHHYDSLVLVGAISGLLLGKEDAWLAVSAARRRIVGMLSIVPFVNLLVAERVLTMLGAQPGDLLHRSVTSINPTCVLLATALLTASLIRPRRSPDSLIP